MKDPKQRTGVSRRAFLQGSSAAAAATALAGGQGLVSAQEAGPEVVRGKREITLNVNDKDHKVQVEPRMTLLEVLRYQLGLTGAKPVSPAGDVGAATVIIDGKPAAADTTLAISCTGKKVQTVESLGGQLARSGRQGLRAQRRRAVRLLHAGLRGRRAGLPR